MAVIGQEGESTDQFRPSGSQDKATSWPEKKEDLKETTPSSGVPYHSDTGIGENKIIKVSPRARNMALKNNLDINKITGQVHENYC